MGLFKKEKRDKNPESNPNTVSRRSSPEWWPDLTAYRKAIFLHNITFNEVDALLKEYAAICSDSKKLVCDFYYASLPVDTTWLYLEFPNFENIPHYLNFWNYNNLLIWLSQKAEKEFCLAIPKNQNQPLFLSVVDEKNPNGDSCVGIYADRDFYFTIPENLFEWGPMPTSPFHFMGFLKEKFQFDTRWIPQTTQCEWKRTQVTLTFPE